MRYFFFLLFLWVIFAFLDPDPATQINADPCGSGSETLVWDPGSEIQDLESGKKPIPDPGSSIQGSLILDPGSKRHRITDPDPQHCYV